MRLVANDRWGQMSLSGGPGDRRGQTGRTVRDLVACLASRPFPSQEEICLCSRADKFWSGGQDWG